MRILARLLWVGAMFMHETSRAQAYTPFPAGNAVWTVTFNSSDCILWFPEMAVQTYRYALVGDTLIAGAAYLKCSVVEACGTCCEAAPVFGYIGAVRDDTVARKVFIVPPDSFSEVVLYDFSVEVGDTIEQAFPIGACSPQVVQWIDSVEVGGSFRRRYHLQGPCWPNEVVEGVGSLTGPLEWAFSVVDVGGMLACLEVDGEQVYEASPGQCALNVSVPSRPVVHQRELKAVADGSGSLNLEFNDGSPLKGPLQILDPMGRSLASMRTGARAAILVPFGHAPTGVYLLRCADQVGQIHTLRTLWLGP